MPFASGWVRRAVVLALLAFATLFSAAGFSRDDWGAYRVPVVAAAELPPEARRTLEAIRRGGPHAYERDGVVFRNYERRLPVRDRGYYREYTVATPGVAHRGARRIVAGRGGELYYTADHYRSFRRILE